MITRTKLLELMSARMFHDLAGPIGAVHNSVEFLEEESQSLKDKALKIIKASANESIARLKFFRQSYGTVGEKMTHLDNFMPLVEEFLMASKLSIVWDLKSEAVNSYIAKVMLNFVVIALGSLIYGGVIHVFQLDNGIKILFEGKKFIFTDDTKFLLNGDISNIALTSSNIQLYYTYMMIEEADALLSISKNSEGLEFLITNKG
jgi:histidine phosphotransferase ChpT